MDLNAGGFHCNGVLFGFKEEAFRAWGGGGNVAALVDIGELLLSGAPEGDGGFLVEARWW